MSGPRLDPHPSFAAWLERESRAGPPPGLSGRVLARTRVTRRRPGWLVVDRWLPAAATARFGASLRAVFASAVVISLVGLAVAMSAGSQPRGLAPGGGAFEPGASLTVGRASHTATLLPDGRVLVIGGHDAGRTSEVRDAVTGVFHSAGSRGDARIGHTATLLPDGAVLIVGGPDIGSAEVWDLGSGSVAHLPIPRDRTDHSATLLADGRVLIVGGLEHPAEADLWDPEIHRFVASGPLAHGRYDHESVLLADGQVLVVGGPAEAELWDPGSQHFTPAGSLAEPRWEASATRLQDGRVLVIGGFAASDGRSEALATAELYDPVTMTFTSAGLLADARGRHTATLLADGRVLVVGGGSRPSAPLAGAELWDPVSRRFMSVDSLEEARIGHTAALLPDGHVLVVGGRGVDGEPLRTTEVWDPHGVAADPEQAGIRSVTWGPRSLDHDWPGPLRTEPEGSPLLVAPRRVVEEITPDRGRVETRTFMGYEDPTGDAPFPWLDIATFTAGPDGATFRLAGDALKPIPDPSERWIAYGVVLDREGDGVPDVRFGMDNAPGGEHRAWQTDLATGETVAKTGGQYGVGVIRVDTWFPGEQPVPGTRSGSFRGGLPGSRMYLWASLIEGGRVVATDHAPDVGWVDATLRPDE